MFIFRLALRNIMGAGLRTWLSVFVLSLSFVAIIWHKGLLDGWDRQAINDLIKWEIAGGQYWIESYDPYDPFSIDNARGLIPAPLLDIISRNEATPLLFIKGTIYPSGRLQSILIKGIDPYQDIIALPSGKLISNTDEIPAIIGSSMSEASGLKEGDMVNMRWRDKNGAFDASMIRICGVYKTNVPSVDVDQVWIPIARLREMLLSPGAASMVVMKNLNVDIPQAEGWDYKSRDDLLADLQKIIKSKTLAGMVIWSILLLVAMLAIFDTQVLSIFRRQKEIGTCIAMGMTQRQVVALFTLEGALHSVLATALGTLYGFPLLATQASRGINLPVSSSDYGLAMAEKLFPVYGAGLILSTVIIVLIITTVVSYWPSRKIARLKPTIALRGGVK